MAVQISSRRKLSGVDLNTNPLVLNSGSSISQPAGRTLVCDNGTIAQTGKIKNRRGFDYFTQELSAQVLRSFEYEGKSVQWQADNTLWLGDRDDPARTQYSGTYEPPEGQDRIDGTVSEGKLFLTTKNGIMVLDGVDSTPIRAGLTKGLDVRTQATGNPGFMNGFGEVAHRMIWKRGTLPSAPSEPVMFTTNNRVAVSSLTRSSSTATCTTATNHGWSNGDEITIEGAVEDAYNGTFVITVTGAAVFTYTVAGSPTSPATGTITAEKYQNVEVQFTVPWDALSIDTWEVYRTVVASADAPTPGDTMFLVGSGTVAGSSAVPGDTITFEDTAEDDILTIQLYTNKALGGLKLSNDRPPIAKVLTTFNTLTIYGNTVVDHEKRLALLTVSSGITNGSEIIITRQSDNISRTYTAGAMENTATNTFLLETGLITPSANIEATVRSICHVINSDEDGQCYAEYNSASNENPGFFRIYAREPLSGAFFITADSSGTGDVFDPVLPTSGETVISENRPEPNAIYFSKDGIPEAVPLENKQKVARKDKAIKRLLTSKSEIHVIKEDGFHGFVNIATLPATPKVIDDTTYILGSWSAVALENGINCFSNKGFVRVDGNSVNTISKLITPALLPLMKLQNLEATCFAVGHESEREYLCWLPSNGSDTYGQYAWRYNTEEKEWSRLLKPAAGGIVLASNRTLYLSSGQELALLKERNDLTSNDKADESLPVIIVSQDEDEITVEWQSEVYTPGPGYTLEQDVAFAKVLSVELIEDDTWLFTIDRSEADYEAGAAIACVPIYSRVLCPPDPGSEAAVVKQYHTVSVVMEGRTISRLTLEINTNEQVVPFETEIIIPLSEGYGDGPYGDFAYGDPDVEGATQIFTEGVPAPSIAETISIGFRHAVAKEDCTALYVANTFTPQVEHEEVG